MSKYDLYYQIALSQYQEQHRRSAGFDSRAVGVMGIAATLGGITAVILKDFSGPSPLAWWSIAIALAVAGVLLGAVRSALKALSPRKWSISPDPIELASHLHSPDYQAKGLTEWVGDELAQSITYNEAVLVAKGKAVICASRLLGLMAVLVIVLAVAVNFGPPR